MSTAAASGMTPGTAVDVSLDGDTRSSPPGAGDRGSETPPGPASRGPTSQDGRTVRRRLAPGEPGAGGYRHLSAADGEQHAVRADLAGVSLPAGWLRSAAPLLVLAHLSDTHVMDHQSPGRAELLDRYSDPGSPLRADVGIIGTYRAQELFTFQVADAMIRAVQATRSAPVCAAPVDFAIVTGDATDNCQLNELRGYLSLLNGGPVRPDSGDPARYEGVCGPDVEDEHYWHPDGGPEDLPRVTFGFPEVPGVLAAARLPFSSRWPRPAVVRSARQSRQHAAGHSGPGRLAARLHRRRGEVRDPARRHRRGRGAAALRAGPERRADRTVARHPAGSHARSGPRDGHQGRARARALQVPAASRPGMATVRSNLAEGTAYYGFDHGVLRCLVLDTVNAHGGWQGSLDAGQLRWLEAELAASAARPVVLFSHHPLETLVNDTRPPGADRRILAAELREVLLAHPNVVAWVNGHTHVHAVTPITDGTAGFWQITTASHIDWPQQARLIEFLAVPDGLAIACTVIDSAAPPSYQGTGDPSDLAALSRELAANDWQIRDLITAEGGAGAGTSADRNVILTVDWPRSAAHARLPRA